MASSTISTVFLTYTTILEVNLFAFAYRLFREDFSSINGASTVDSRICLSYIVFLIYVYECVLTDPYLVTEEPSGETDV